MNTNTVIKDETDALIAMLNELDTPRQPSKEATEEILKDLSLEVDVEFVASSIEEETAFNGEKLLEQIEEDANFASGKLPDPVPEICVSEPEPEKVTETQEEKATEPRPQKIASKKQKRFSLDELDGTFFDGLSLERTTFMAAYNAAPLKAMDKMHNILAWYSGRAELSVYTQIALSHLLETKVVTSNSLKMAMMSNPSKPYPVSTASSQAGQMIAALPALGIAVKEGKDLTLNPDSPLLKKFQSDV